MLIDNGDWVPMLRSPDLAGKRHQRRKAESREFWGGLLDGGCWLNRELRQTLAALAGPGAGPGAGSAFRAQFAARQGSGGPLGLLVADDVLVRIDGRLQEAQRRLGGCTPDQIAWREALAAHHQGLVDMGYVCL